MSGKSSLVISEDAIGNVLRKTELHLAVPINQRSYSWKEEHVIDLYQDWSAALDEGRDEYFLGSLVVVPVGARTEVFDGQQRLATTTILIAAIRDFFLTENKDEKTASLIEHDFLFSQDRETHESIAHLILNAEDNGFFADRILARPDDPERQKATNEAKRESHKKISKAATLARDHVSSRVRSLAEAARGKHLHAWLNFLEKNVRIIWVKVADTRTAFLIFETMNDRGLKLSASDLLKNLIYSFAGEKKDEATQKWQAMTAILESIAGEEDGIVEYIRFYWITGHGPTRTKDLYDEMKKEVTNKTKAIGLATDLEAAAHNYEAVLSSSHETWASYRPGVRAKVATLKLLGVTQIRPLLLAAKAHFTPGEMERLLDACISWSVRALIGGVPSGTLEAYYGNNALGITKKKITKVKEIAADLIKIIPDDTRFRAAVENAYVARENLARYYLRALQRQADGEKEPYYVPNEGSEITLEHILPKKPGNKWQHITPDQQKALCSRLGNLALLADTVNGGVGSEEYAVKKKALAACKFSLTKMAGKATQWGAEEIGKRQKKLAELAVLTWPMVK